MHVMSLEVHIIIELVCGVEILSHYVYSVMCRDWSSNEKMLSIEEVLTENWYPPELHYHTQYEHTRYISYQTACMKAP